MNLRRIAVVVLLSALTCTLSSCGRQEPTTPPSDKAAPAASALPESSQRLLALLPSADEIPGWAPKGQPKFFGPGNLWEFIDGAAEGYLAFGFEEVVSARFSSGSREVVADVYKMKDRVNAFGIYAQELNPDAQFITAGVEGHATGTTVSFWAHEYYVKITAYEEQAEIQHAMQAIAVAVERKIGPAGSAPAEIDWFPKAGQVPHSVAYVPKDVLGQSYLSGAFEAKYGTGPAEYRLLVVGLQDADQTAQAFASYRKFLAGQGEATKDFSLQATDGGFTGNDRFYAQVMAVRSGRFIVIALGIPSPAVGRDAIAQVLANIKKAEVS